LPDGQGKNLIEELICITGTGGIDEDSGEIMVSYQVYDRKPHARAAARDVYWPLTCNAKKQIPVSYDQGKGFDPYGGFCPP
jgi:hypothetical protein